MQHVAAAVGTEQHMVAWQARYDRKSLGQLVAQLLQFMEDALGINVR